MMETRENLAVKANKKSIEYAMAGNKDAWLALYTEDAVVCDPVGVSAMDPSGQGHRGKAAIEAFWDTVIGPASLTITPHRRWVSGEHSCCVHQVARNDMGDGNFTECDMLAVYTVNEEGLLTAMSAYWDFDDMMAQLSNLSA